jgi:hypothetical protein
MNPFEKISAVDRLEAMEEVAYMVDASGTIRQVGHTRWREFALAGGAPGLGDPSRVVGRSLFAFIFGEEVRESYLRLHRVILSGRRARIAFPYRCDAPDLRRDMWMTVTPVRSAGVPVGVLYRSSVRATEPRATWGFLGARAADVDVESLPLLTACSYCRSVKIPEWLPPAPDRPGRGSAEAEGGWIDGDEYHRRGGTDRVRLSHGICVDCRRAIVEPFLAGIRGRAHAA